MTRNEYELLQEAKISDSRTAVISRHSRGGFTIAQRLGMVEDGHTTNVFLKGALHVADVDGLINLREAINRAINMMDPEDLECIERVGCKQ